MCVTCPTCDDEFDDQRSMYIHHKMSHGKSINHNTCGHCGEEFSPRSNDQQYCSRDCYFSDVEGKDNPRWKERVKIVCEWCNEMFEVPPHDSDRVYCSQDCYNEYLASLTGEDNRVWTEYERVCEHCGERYQGKKHSKKRFCSMECYNEYKVGENHPGWKGGNITWYGSNWHSISEKVRERDNRECKKCGKDSDDHYRKLSVHHIESIREFETREEANSMDNLVTLCIGCHHQIEANNMDCPEP